MPTRRNVLFGALGSLSAAGLPAAARALATPPGRGLQAYRSEEDFKQALQRWQGRSRSRGRATRELAANLGGAADAGAAMPPPAMAAAPAAEMAQSKSAAPSPSARADGITNVQTAGVDEGGIVKHAGDFLVILRRGRLFTVRVGDDDLDPMAMVDAYAPGLSPQGAWYDELLVSGSTVVVVGYSYARGGTEIGLFHLDRQGGLRHRATHHLRSFDYYASRNYASRLIGRRLIFYTPSFLQPWDHQPWEQLPAVRHWHGSAAAPFRRILPATRIYRADDDFDPDQPLALHTVTQCDLDAPDLACRSTAVLGPAGRVFYVSNSAVYVWTTGTRQWPVQPALPQEDDEEAALHGRPQPARRSQSVLFRLPLDEAQPSALRTAGVPIDQMSFLEDDGGHLNVLLREAGPGEGMWGAEGSAGSMALLRVAVGQFGDGQAAAGQEHYRRLPTPAGGALQNRFVGDWLLWGGAAPPRQWPGDLDSEPYDPGREEERDAQAAGPSGWALRYATAMPPRPLRPGHGIERIEALGRDAVLVGSAGADLHFSSVDLTRRGARVAGHHVQRRAAQGETRTHGFFYRAEAGGEGLLGLPVIGGRAGRRGGVHGGPHGSAGVLYLRQRALQLLPLGRLQASGHPYSSDACKASCVDWYGNARPIFLGERVFALLGYELVEGRVAGPRDGAERIDEVRRVSFAPGRRPPGGARAWPFD